MKFCPKSHIYWEIKFLLNFVQIYRNEKIAYKLLYVLNADQNKFHHSPLWCKTFLINVSINHPGLHLLICLASNSSAVQLVTDLEGRNIYN